MTELAPYEGPPDINRLLAVLRGEKTDRVPHLEILIEDAHVTALLGRPAGNTLAVAGEPGKGNAASEHARPMRAADYIELCRRIGQDAIIMEALWTPQKLTHIYRFSDTLRHGTIKLSEDGVRAESLPNNGKYAFALLKPSLSMNGPSRIHFRPNKLMNLRVGVCY